MDRNDYKAEERDEQHGKPVSFRAPPDLARRIELEASRELLSVSAFNGVQFCNRSLSALLRGSDEDRCATQGPGRR